MLSMEEAIDFHQNITLRIPSRQNPRDNELGPAGCIVFDFGGSQLEPARWTRRGRIDPRTIFRTVNGMSDLDWPDVWAFQTTLPRIQYVVAQGCGQSCICLPPDAVPRVKLGRIEPAVLQSFSILEADIWVCPESEILGDF